MLLVSIVSRENERTESSFGKALLILIFEFSKKDDFVYFKGEM
jgi:hypothetical protein